MRLSRFFALVTLILTVLSTIQVRAARPGEGGVLRAVLAGDHQATIDWQVFGSFKRLRLLRTVSPITQEDLHRPRYPVVELIASTAARGEGCDDALAHGIQYHYWLEVERNDGTMDYQKTDLDVPNRALPAELNDLTILIDKTHYFLEVRDHAEMVKRYPVALGADPVNRKLYQDSSCTPEGVYRVTQLQHEAAYYRAIDIDYPNSRDRLRFAVGQQLGLIPAGRRIGGQIQIHGDILKEVAVYANWTYGCIAMRNDDIDELFSRPELARGVYVFIVGKSLSYEDLESVLSPWTREEILQFQETLARLSINPVGSGGTQDNGLLRALGVYQKLRGLPFTCELDARTVKSLRSERTALSPQRQALTSDR